MIICTCVGSSPSSRTRVIPGRKVYFHSCSRGRSPACGVVAGCITVGVVDNYVGDLKVSSRFSETLDWKGADIACKVPSQNQLLLCRSLVKSSPVSHQLHQPGMECSVSLEVRDIPGPNHNSSHF